MQLNNGPAWNQSTLQPLPVETPTADARTHSCGTLPHPLSGLRRNRLSTPGFSIHMYNSPFRRRLQERIARIPILCPPSKHPAYAFQTNLFCQG